MKTQLLTKDECISLELIFVIVHMCEPKIIESYNVDNIKGAHRYCNHKFH